MTHDTATWVQFFTALFLLFNSIAALFVTILIQRRLSEMSSAIRQISALLDLLQDDVAP